MTDKRLDDYLGAAQELARLSAHAERLARLQRVYADIAPAALLRGSRVANTKDEKLTLHAVNGAYAAKLKNLAPRLAEKFRQRGFQVAAVEVRVRVGMRIDEAPAGRSPRAPLSEATTRRLMDLAAALPESSPVRRALIGLIERGKA